MKRTEGTARRKLDKTFADYIGIAISPVLIMAMIGSLILFLLEISYEGEYAGRLRWTIFWFVLATVLISRISIEQGSAYAGIYGGALALATGAMISRFVNFALGVWCFLALIWWCASKLTWDCTLIDEDEDASGEGLLQVAGLGESPRRTGLAENGETGPRAKVSLWRQILMNRSEQAGRPHAPGLWVVYFSLFALPLFGVGQLLIPQSDRSRREYGFLLLWIYAAAALGLLLTTSFLGLRRYLRQRHLQMPPRMARSWIGLGTVLAAGILLFCVLLPRPEAEYSLTALVGKIGSPPSAVSESSLFRDRFGEGPEAKSEAGGGGGKAASDGEVKGGTGRGPAEPSTPQSRRLGRLKSGTSILGASLADLLKWALYGLFVVLVAYALIRNWSQVTEALRQIIRDFVDFWMRLFGLDRTIQGPTVRAGSVGPRMDQRRFSSFTNPFVTGEARRMMLSDLVCYSFEALQVWAHEFGLARRPEQTPLEFARVLGSGVPEICADVQQVTHAYAKIAYAGRAPAPECLDLLERLWRRMSASRGMTANPTGSDRASDSRFRSRD